LDPKANSPISISDEGTRYDGLTLGTIGTIISFVACTWLGHMDIVACTAAFRAPSLEPRIDNETGHGQKSDWMLLISWCFGLVSDPSYTDLILYSYS
jgi:hypothetical protein